MPSLQVASPLKLDSCLALARASTSEQQRVIPKFLRYPGGKSKLLPILSKYFPNKISGRYIDPFIGGASVLFYLQPGNALISDLNADLIDLYTAIRDRPIDVWKEYCLMPNDKEGYYRIRSLDKLKLAPPFRAARTLYLNRTCFKGMWRHNLKGAFNIGYGGESRRAVINEPELQEVSGLLQNVEIRCTDFEPIIDLAKSDDFVFIDPPYKPGSKEMTNAHYVGQTFTFQDQVRLASALCRASKRGVSWVMTNSAHPDITRLYEGCEQFTLPMCTGSRPGIMEDSGNEIVVYND